MNRFTLYLLAGLVFSVTIAQAQIFGTVRGSVFDLQKLPIPGATITLKTVGSAWTGEFMIAAVPAGAYAIEMDHQGF